MGGVFTSVQLKAIEAPVGKKRSTLLALHKAISKSILDKIWRRCSYGAFRATAGSYLSDEQGDGYRGSLWEATADELSWSFMDHAGCCNGSSSACYHWFELCLTANRESFDKMAAARGYQLIFPPRVLQIVLLSCDYPLLSADTQPYCVPAFSLGKLDWEEDWNGPFWDDGSPRPKLADFSGHSLDEMTRTALTGLCCCGLCYSLRYTVGFTHLSDLQQLKEAWLLCSSKTKQKEVVAVAKALRSFSGWEQQKTGPAELHKMSSSLGKISLQWWELAGLCCRIARKLRE
jgi:hypothetical protein